VEGRRRARRYFLAKLYRLPQELTSAKLVCVGSRSRARRRLRPVFALLAKLPKLGFLIGSQDIHDLFAAFLAIGYVGSNLLDLLLLRITQSQLGKRMPDAFASLTLRPGRRAVLI
jgi:hypothetical protein